MPGAKKIFEHLLAAYTRKGHLREPLNGDRAILPVPDKTKVWKAPPTAAINLPGLCISVGEMLAALERHSLASVLDLVDRSKDKTTPRIVSSWRGDFSVPRATNLGFSLGASNGEYRGSQ